MGLTVVFQLTFTFIYNTFNNNFLILTKQAVSKRTISLFYSPLSLAQSQKA